MFRLKNVFFYLVGVLLIGAIIAPIIWVMVNVLSKLAIVGMISLPFYGLYRVKKGNKSKAIKDLLLPVVKFIKKAVKVNVYNFSMFLITGVVLALLFESLVVSFVKTLVLCVVALFATYVAWEVVRYCCKAFKNIEIPEFKFLVQSAIK